SGEPDLVGDDLTAPVTAGGSTTPSQEVTQVAPPSLSPADQPSVAVSATPSGTATSSATSTPTSEPSPSASDDPNPPAAPGRLVAAPRTLDLGASGGRTLTLTNPGGTTVTYSVVAEDSWLATSPASGSLKPGQSRSVTVSARRGGLPEGTSSGGLTVRWDEGTVPIAVSAAREVPPTIGAVSVVPSECDQPVDVVVPISDESGVASASVAWAGPSASGTTALTASGGQWSGSIGPFAVGGTVQLSFVATDTRGNTARRSASISVDPCPG
ncbi:MAG: hypothetical protein JHD21_18970, partial [Nocardioides sp.]|nr:hypothetical protein [Nocardioides sp.]